jgi:Ca-activated chloride channel family protein
MFFRHYVRLGVLAILPLAFSPSDARVAAQPAVFRASSERVMVAIVARDGNGRAMPGLSAADFEVFDRGEPRRILDFRNDLSPISVALLLDTSGSMHIGFKMQRANEVGHFLLASMNEGVDEAALFVFDKTVRTAQPFTGEFDAVRAALASVDPYGSTSLYDAIAATAQQLALRPGRRALVVLTDGVDTSSQLTAPEVSGIASAIDMPVYVVAVDTSIDVSAEHALKAEDASGHLSDLARWSGGMFYRATNPAEGSIAARQIVTDLQHQYLIAFEPGAAPGWHRIEVRARQKMTLQARSGYWVGPSALGR